MAKKVIGQIKLQIPAGKATPAPPVGPALGQHGVNIMGFTKEFNAKTADQAGMIIPVVITVYQDRSFSFITKTPPAAVLIKKALNLKSGSGEPNKKKVAKMTSAQVREISKLKYSKDLIEVNFAGTGSDIESYNEIVKLASKSPFKMNFLQILFLFYHPLFYNFYYKIYHHYNHYQLQLLYFHLLQKSL